MRMQVRAMVPGPEHVEQLAASATNALHHLSMASQQLYTLADEATIDATAKSSGGAMDFLANAFESILKVLEGGLQKANVPYSYGFAIILLTVMVKVATFPLSKKSMESTMAMQAVQPRVKELQAKYANEPETLQVETARLYKNAGINPLAGCLPTLATIPVFIGLYRALTKAADDGLLTSGFFWIPSLAGPSSLAARQAGTGLSWLFPFVDGHPPIGWATAGAYLVLPVLLVISQYLSQKLVSPQSQDPAQQQTQAILKFIPFMIGWFSLNVPSGLTLYWLVNNIISTGQQVYMKKTIKVELPGVGAVPASQAIIDVEATPIRPKEDRSKKVSGKDTSARKKKRDEDDEAPSTSGSAAAAPKGDGRGSKFRARKAREAAGKAASLASPPATNGAAAAQGQAEASKTATATSELDRLKVPDAPPQRD